MSTKYVENTLYGRLFDDCISRLRQLPYHQLGTEVFVVVLKINRLWKWKSWLFYVLVSITFENKHESNSDDKIIKWRLTYNIMA